jgi:hypothetical protein
MPQNPIPFQPAMALDDFFARENAGAECTALERALAALGSFVRTAAQ